MKAITVTYLEFRNLERGQGFKLNSEIYTVIDKCEECTASEVIELLVCKNSKGAYKVFKFNAIEGKKVVLL